MMLLMPASIYTYNWAACFCLNILVQSTHDDAYWHLDWVCILAEHEVAE